MENHRIYYAHQAENELNSLKIYKRRTEDTIKRCKHVTGTDEILNKLATLKNKLAEYVEKIEAKEREIEEIRSGQRDNIIKEQINKNSNILKNKKRENKRKKQQESKELAEAKDRADHYFQRGYYRNRNNRPPSKRQMGYEYERFIRNCNKIPDYMRRKLSNMPNNKGYIWRGIWLLGHRRSEIGQPTIIFERKGKDILLIHEFDQYEHRIYEKKGKSRKVLSRTITRRRRS